jgi:hypothetical protein
MIEISLGVFMKNLLDESQDMILPLELFLKSEK